MTPEETIELLFELRSELISKWVEYTEKAPTPETIDRLLVSAAVLHVGLNPLGQKLDLRNARE